MVSRDDCRATAAQEVRQRRVRTKPAWGRYDGLVKQLFACVTLMAVFSAAGIAQSGNAEALVQVKSIYVLPMSRGMDQYLASSLTRGAVVQVVTDASRADALLTDHLGASFEASVKDLYPDVKPAKTEDEKASASDAKPDDSQMKSSGADRPLVSGRNRGMVFLVKRGTSEVLWSSYYDPSIRTPKELDRMAGKLSAGLKKAMAPVSAPASGGK